MIVAADHMTDSHVPIIHDNRQHIGRRSVRAQQHHVVQLGIGHRDAPLNRVLNCRFPLERRLEANHGIDAGRCIGRIAVTPAAVIEPRLTGGARPFAHFGQLLRAAEAIVGLAFGQQGFRAFHVAVGASGLVDRLAVPIQTQPCKSIQNGADCILG